MAKPFGALDTYACPRCIVNTRPPRAAYCDSCAISVSSAVSRQLAELTAPASRARERAAVVWFRRFRADQSKAMLEILFETGRTFYTPITLEDSAIGRYRAVWRWRVGIVIITLFFVTFPVVCSAPMTGCLSTTSGLDGQRLGALGFLLLVVLVPAVAALSSAAIGRLSGRLVVNGPERLSHLDAFLSRVRKPPTWTTPKFVVISASDTVWRDAVDRTLAVADAVIFDAANWNATLAWEFRRALDRVPAEAILFVYGTSLRETEEDAHRAIDRIMGATTHPPPACSRWVYQKEVVAKARLWGDARFVAGPSGPVVRGCFGGVAPCPRRLNASNRPGLARAVRVTRRALRSRRHRLSIRRSRP
jgi:hypothetical protein